MFCRRAVILAILLLLSKTTCCFAQLNAPTSQTVEVENGIKISRNLPYTNDNDSARSLDLFLPAKAASGLTLIVLIHGGGWSAGSKSDFDGACLDLVRHGYAAASINYRLSSQAIFPAQVIDCKAAVRYLRANSVVFGVNPGRIVVGGHSAGGHLAAFLGVTNGLKQFDQGDNLQVSSDVQAVIWCAGVGDLLKRAETPGYEGEESAGSGESMLIGGPLLLNQDKARAASPMTYVSGRTAPFVFFHGDADKLVPVGQATDMYSAVRSHGIYAELHILPGADHGGPGYFTFQMWRNVDLFLEHVLKTRAPSIPRFNQSQRYMLAPAGAATAYLETRGDRSVGFYGAVHPLDQTWRLESTADGCTVVHPAYDVNLALTVDDGGTSNMTPVSLVRYAGLASQQWQIFFNTVTDTYSLLPKCAPGSALDDFSGGLSPESKVDIFGFSYSDPHLQWTLSPAR